MDSWRAATDNELRVVRRPSYLGAFVSLWCIKSLLPDCEPPRHKDRGAELRLNPNKIPECSSLLRDHGFQGNPSIEREGECGPMIGKSVAWLNSTLRELIIKEAKETADKGKRHLNQYGKGAKNHEKAIA